MIVMPSGHLHKGCDRHGAGPIVRGKRVVDVGCGTGVAGLAAAALGAASVTLTDLPHLLPLVERNIQANQLSSVASAAALTWGDTDSACRLRPPFDVVLASDVIYQADAIPALIRTLQQLSAPHTVILLAIEHREKLPFPRHQFEQAGFEVAQVPYSELHPDWRSDDIFIYKISLAGAE